MPSVLCMVTGCQPVQLYYRDSGSLVPAAAATNTESVRPLDAVRIPCAGASTRCSHAPGNRTGPNRSTTSTSTQCTSTNRTSAQRSGGSSSTESSSSCSPERPSSSSRANTRSHSSSSSSNPATSSNPAAASCDRRDAGGGDVRDSHAGKSRRQVCRLDCG